MPQPSRTILIAENWDGDYAAEPDVNDGFGQPGKFWPYHSSENIKGGVFIFCDGHAKWMSVRDTERPYVNGKPTFWYWWANKKGFGP